MAALIVNALNFQLLWLCCVIFADMRALVALLVFFLIHAALPGSRLHEWRYIVFFVAFGLLIESSLASIGLIEFTGQFEIYRSGNSAIVIAPLWLLAMWAGFAACIDHSLKPLLLRPALFWIVIAAGVPASYALGAELSHSQLLVPTFTFLSCELLLWLALLWVFKNHVKQAI